MILIFPTLTAVSFSFFLCVLFAYFFVFKDAPVSVSIDWLITALIYGLTAV